MNVDFRYLGSSAVREGSTGSSLVFAPNLTRPKVSFDGEVRDAIRFREAMSALHEVVVGDLKFKKRDKSSYLAWRAQRVEAENQVRQALTAEAKQIEIQRIVKEPIPPNLASDFKRLHRQYWDARFAWSRELQKNDPAMYRALVPCDPVITVAPDVVFFECFAKDESSYGCLSVDRDAFTGSDSPALGTTNVDYSLALYDHFQTLRSYRKTRLQIDPTGFEVSVAQTASVREEKIDLPASWLRGFGQLQAAMTLPSRRVVLSTDVVYSILAHLKRHREKTGPRSLVFRLVPGKAPQVILEPWGITLTSRGRLYEGPTALDIKVWGRRRLFALARLLPMTEHVEVSLLGSGLPSVWIAHMGEMRFTLALSGWTANDWTRGSNLDQHFANVRSDPAVASALATVLAKEHVASLQYLRTKVIAEDAVLSGSLHALAKRGQVVFDFAQKRYRWRSILAVELSESMLGPDAPEVVAARSLTAEITRQEQLSSERRLVVGRVGEVACEGVVDTDGAFTRAKCSCSFFFRNRLRAGPCRHLMALRTHLTRLP